MTYQYKVGDIIVGTEPKYKSYKHIGVINGLEKQTWRGHQLVTVSWQGYTNDGPWSADGFKLSPESIKLEDVL